MSEENTKCFCGWCRDMRLSEKLGEGYCKKYNAKLAAVEVEIGKTMVPTCIRTMKCLEGEKS